MLIFSFFIILFLTCFVSKYFHYCRTSLKGLFLLCGGLNKNDPHRIIYLITGSTVGRTVSKGSGGVTVLKDVTDAGFVVSKAHAIAS